MKKHKGFRLNNLLESLQPIEKLLPTWKRQPLQECPQADKFHIYHFASLRPNVERTRNHSDWNEKEKKIPTYVLNRTFW